MGGVCGGVRGRCFVLGVRSGGQPVALGWLSGLVGKYMLPVSLVFHTIVT